MAAGVRGDGEDSCEMTLEGKKWVKREVLKSGRY